ncbi:MAG: transcriptional repressor [Lachnospiraceae bacterium]|nr:transcriptional repressor [Lachnospiraceae bacterium]
MNNDNTYYANHIEKTEILNKLRANGCRITKQREALIDVILQEECTCCKEIYYSAVKKIPQIGIATIYRMVNSLEEIGAIRKENPYRVCCKQEKAAEGCLVEFEDKGIVEFDMLTLQRIIEKGMEACGYCQQGSVQNISLKYCS